MSRHPACASSEELPLPDEVTCAISCSSWARGMVDHTLLRQALQSVDQRCDLRQPGSMGAAKGFVFVTQSAAEKLGQGECPIQHARHRRCAIRRKAFVLQPLLDVCAHLRGLVAVVLVDLAQHLLPCLSPHAGLVRELLGEPPAREARQRTDRVREKRQQGVQVERLPEQRHRKGAATAGSAGIRSHRESHGEGDPPRRRFRRAATRPRLRQQECCWTHFSAVAAIHRAPSSRVSARWTMTVPSSRHAIGSTCCPRCTVSTARCTSPGNPCRAQRTTGSLPARGNGAAPAATEWGKHRSDRPVRSPR